MPFFVAPNAINRLVFGMSLTIVSVQDAEGKECKDAVLEIDFAKNTEEVLACVGIELSGRAMKLDVFVELLPDNQVHGGFYGGDGGKGCSLPRVAVIEENFHASPSCIQLDLDGRDVSEYKRILLPGEYVLVVEGKIEGRVRARAETRIVVAPPNADLVGLRCVNRHGDTESTQKEMDAAMNVLKAAPKGPSYDSVLTYANWAPEVLKRWGKASVTTFSGHSNPLGLWLYNGDGGRPKGPKISWIAVRNHLDGSDADHSYSIPTDGSLKDLLFVLLNGCRGGNEVMGVQEQLNTIHTWMGKTRVTGVLDHETEVGLKYWQTLFDLEVTKKPDAPTIAHMKLNVAGLDETAQLRKVQAHLRARAKLYTCGKADGVWGKNTAAGIKAFQTDAGLPVNGLPDKPTRDQLKIGERVHSGVNTAEAFVNAGSDMSIGFVKSVAFGTSTKWQVRFYQQLQKGLSFADAAEAVMQSLRASERDDMEYNFYTRDKVQGDEETLFPARYGRSV